MSSVLTIMLIYFYFLSKILSKITKCFLFLCLFQHLDGGVPPPSVYTPLLPSH